MQYILENLVQIIISIVVCSVLVVQVKSIMRERRNKKPEPLCPAQTGGRCRYCDPCIIHEEAMKKQL